MTEGQDLPREHEIPLDGSRLKVDLGKTPGAYAAQPITRPDRRYPKTRVARPDDDGVEENRDWVNFNEK